MADAPPVVVQPSQVDDPLVGQTLVGRYKVLELVDRGGMGKIYTAEQVGLGRVVALKTLDVHDPSGEFQKRFWLEAAVCAKLNHPNTVRMFDYGVTDDGLCFLVMELLVGAQLNDVIQEEAPLAPLRAIRIVRQVASALQEAHDQGVVHRDVKPQNVFLTPHGDDAEFAKVIDFGLVKDLQNDSELSRTGNVLGSPMYMAPEQVEGGDVDARTDVYALGLVLYCMLTGKTPFKRGNSLSVMMQQVHKDPAPFREVAPDLDLPASLEWVVRTATKKPREERFASMRELSKALKACEREVRGDVGPLSLSLADGNVVLPGAMADEPGTEEVRLPGRKGPRLADDASGTPAGRRTGPTLLAVLVVAALLVAFAGVAMLLGGGAAIVVAMMRDTPARHVYVEPGPQPVAPVPVEPPAAEVVAPRAVALTSDPTGAEVVENGVVIGHTPMTIDVPVGAEREIWFEKAGHEPAVYRIDGSKDAVSAFLAPLRRRDPGPTPKPTAPFVPPPGDPPPGGEAPAGDGAKIDEIKDPFR